MNYFNVINEVLLKCNDPGEFLVSQLQEVYYGLIWGNSNNNTFHDVNLCCKDGQTIKAHAAVLAVASLHLKNILMATWNPHTETSISLDDFNSKDVQNVIEFLYTGKISLNSRSDFDMFQQLIFEWQIGYNDYPIILEEDEEFQNRIRILSYELMEIPPLIPIESGDQSVVLFNNGNSSENRQVNKIKLKKIIDKPYRCDWCSRAFPAPHNLEKHKKTHTEERPYSCHVCGKTFRYASTLYGHMVVHSEDRPFSCNVCDKSFRRKYNLTVHQRIHNEDNLLQPAQSLF